jgi:hypothetical protein
MAMVHKVAVVKARYGSIAKICIFIAATLLVGCRISVNITTISPQDETITFDKTDDIVLAPGSVLQVTINESFDSYEWMLDSAILAGQNSSTVTVDCTPLAFGVHHLSAFVEKNGQLYSTNLRFWIEN